MPERRTTEGWQELILKLLTNIAPEVDPKTIQADQPLREQIDIDSMDFLGLVTKIYEMTGIDIPESDYTRLTTLKKIVDYLAQR